MEGVIPALDLMDGQVVRLQKGDFNTREVYGDPLDLAKQMSDLGYQRLHVVDLDGARLGKVTHQKVVEDMVRATGLQIDFGGGVHKQEDVQSLLNCGVQWVCLGTSLVKTPDVVESWMAEFGGDRFFCGVDVRGNAVAVSGWEEQTDVHWRTVIEPLIDLGANYFFMTDIQSDGMMQGAAWELYRRVLKEFPKIQLVASGGVRSQQDVQLALDFGLVGAITGKAFLKGLIDNRFKC